MSNELIIKKGSVVLFRIPRELLIEALPTHDGLVFNFKEGFFLNYQDQYLSIEIKELITTTLIKPIKANIEVDLLSKTTPISINMLWDLFKENFTSNFNFKKLE